MTATSKMFWRCPVCQGAHELSKANLKLAMTGSRTLQQFCNVKLMLIEIDLSQLQTSKSGENETGVKSSNNGWA